MSKTKGAFAYQCSGYGSLINSLDYKRLYNFSENNNYISELPDR
jgi:hypothetical protein